MGTFLKIAGADFSASGIRVERLIAEMPSRGLLGLWLFDDMPVGQGFQTVWDQSGNGRHARLMPGYSPAVRISAGAAVSGPHGAIYDTGLTFNRSMTIIGALANPLPGGEANYYNTLYNTTASGFDTTPSNSNPTTAPVLNYFGTSAAPGGSSTLSDNGRDQIGMDGLSMDGAPGYALPGAFAVTVDGSAGVLTGEWLRGVRSSAMHQGVRTYWDGVTDRGNLIIGVHPYAAVRSAASVLANIYGYAVYDRPLPSAEAQSHMERLRQIASRRGVVWP